MYFTSRFDFDCPVTVQFTYGMFRTVVMRNTTIEYIKMGDLKSNAVENFGEFTGRYLCCLLQYCACLDLPVQ